METKVSLRATLKPKDDFPLSRKLIEWKLCIVKDESEDEALSSQQETNRMETINNDVGEADQS